MQQTNSQATGPLGDRGVGWQATGFALTGIACLALLKVFDGSDSDLYQWFEAASVDLYWAFVVPLAALFDGGRKLFEKGQAIREAQKARMIKRALEKEHKRIRKALEKQGVTLSPEVAEAVFGNKTENSQ